MNRKGTTKETLSKRQALRDQRMKKQRQQRLVLILGVGAVALLILALIIVPNFLPVEIVEVEPNSRPQAEANSMGDPNAPVKIVEYSDFQCPFCKNFADDTEQAIVDAYVATGKVHFTYRSMGNFVSNNIQGGRTESRDAAEAAYCAGDQNKFWEYKDMLFGNWQGEDVGSFSEKRLMAMAEAIDLDMNAFRSCYDGRKYRDQVEQDLQDGTAAGVTGTPSFLINGKLIVGAQPFSEFQTEIEAALASGG